MNFQRPDGHSFKQARILECVSELCIRSMKLCIPFNTSSMSGSPEVLLPIHWATLEDNDDVESVEKEQSDITKSDISFGKIGH